MGLEEVDDGAEDAGDDEVVEAFGDVVGVKVEDDKGHVGDGGDFADDDADGGATHLVFGLEDGGDGAIEDGEEDANGGNRDADGDVAAVEVVLGDKENQRGGDGHGDGDEDQAEGEDIADDFGDVVFVAGHFADGNGVEAEVGDDAKVSEVFVNRSVLAVKCHATVGCEVVGGDFDHEKSEQ